MILGVFGPGHVHGKKYDNYGYVCDILDNYDGLTRIVTGGGVGVEQLALRYATAHSIAPDVIPPNIQAHGADKAFIYRNQEILDEVDMALLIWDGNGTFYPAFMLDCVARKKLLHVRHIE